MEKKYIVTLFDNKNRASYELRKVKVMKEVKDTNWDEGNKLVDYGFVQKRMNNLLGQVLTVVDASVHENKQNKAMKDLIKGIFVEEYSSLTELLLDKNAVDEACTLDEEDFEEIEEVTMDEALGLK